MVHERLHVNRIQETLVKTTGVALCNLRLTYGVPIRTETMAVGIMAPPVEPITKVFDGAFSTEGAMEDGGRSPESGKKGKLLQSAPGKKFSWEIWD